MPRKRRRVIERREPLAPGLRHWLETGEWTPGEGAAAFTVLAALRLPGGLAAGLAAVWRRERDALLADWVAAHPGTRPWAWWECEAPEPRARRGGVGTPAHEGLASVPRFRFGIPVFWVTAFDEAYYNGRAVDGRGERIGTPYHEGHFLGRAIDPDDPPLFESEASYLDRLGRLGPEERRHLAGDAFESEAIPVDIDTEQEPP